MSATFPSGWHVEVKESDAPWQTCDLNVEFLLVFLLRLWDPTFIFPIPNCLNTKFPQFQFFVCPFVCLSTCSLLISSVMCMYVLTLWMHECDEVDLPGPKTVAYRLDKLNFSCELSMQGMSTFSLK